MQSRRKGHFPATSSPMMTFSLWIATPVPSVRLRVARMSSLQVGKVKYSCVSSKISQWPHVKVLSKINAKVLPSDNIYFPEGSPSDVARSIQGNLFRVSFYLLLLCWVSSILIVDSDFFFWLMGCLSQLSEEKDKCLAKERKIKALKLKMKNQDEAGVWRC